MVILKNIKKMGEDISADYYPEGKEPRGYMKIRHGEIIEHENAGTCTAVHVRCELRRLVEMENPPTEKTILWY